jgi:hypothetical protein
MQRDDLRFITCVYRKLDSAILVVKATEDCVCRDGSEALNRAMERRVFVQGTMSPRLIIVGSIRAKDTAQVRFPEYDHVVLTVPADRANEPLNVTVLPGGSGAARLIRSLRHRGTPVHPAATQTVARRNVATRFRSCDFWTAAHIRLYR